MSHTYSFVPSTVTANNEPLFDKILYFILVIHYLQMI